MGSADRTSLMLVVFLSMAAGAVSTAISINLARTLNVLATPTARGSHKVPTPRLGGFGYFIPLTILVTVILWKPILIYIPAWGLEPSLKTLFRLALICGSLAFFVGLMDDFLRLPPWFKLIGQIACAGLFVYLGSQMQYSVRASDIMADDGHVIQLGPTTILKGVGFPHVAFGQGLVLDSHWANLIAKTGKLAAHIPPLPLIVTFLWIIILMNAYNFMDGIDGLAGTFVIAVALGLFAVYVPEVKQTMALRAHICVIMSLAALLVGLSLGFLFYNRPPASTFLGDCGSQYVGFTLAALLAQVTRLATEPAVDGTNGELDMLLHKRAYVDFLAVVILVFPFLYDVTYTLLRRLLRGKAVWRAHHEHLYQRLIDRGWSHWGVVLFSLPFYLANAAIFVAYCWADYIPVQKTWPAASDQTVLQRRWFWAAVALAPMILYTLIVIVVEKLRPLAAEPVPVEPAPVPSEPESAPAEAAVDAEATGDKPEKT